MKSLSHQPLVDHLRSVTWPRHETFEKLPFVIAMTNGTLPLESYLGQLRGLAVILSTLEHTLAQSRSPLIERLRPLLKSRFKMLCDDLAFFACNMVPDIVPAIKLALAFSRQIRRDAGESPDKLLGYLYVLEGTTRGNQVHLPDIVCCFDLKDERGVSFYRGYGDATETHWEEFRSVMNDAGSETLIAAEQGTVEIYEALERFHEALYPVNQENLGFTATSLNPEAGDHPVPQNREILEAALKAGQQCRDEFSYYEKRYGERGRRFTESDVAWLAALIDQPAEIITQQAFWLGRVLSNRGMPLLLLERQLQLLVKNLSKVAVSTEALQTAITNMRRQRLSTIPQENFDKACRELEDTISYTSIADFPDLPTLLVASQIDLIAGIPECKALLIAWLTEKSILAEDELVRVHGTLDSLNSGRGR
jgi:heme oxygenase